MTAVDADALVADLRASLAPFADPTRAAASQRYLKTAMPMLGVPRPDQKRVFRAVFARHGMSGRGSAGADDSAAWDAAVRRLWAEPEREAKYAAIALLQVQRGRFLTLDAVPLLEQLVREGAWWDLVDEIAAHAVGAVVARDRAAMRPVLERWIADPDPWVRRTALLAQLRHRADTDVALLLDLCLRQAPDRSFWIRKAIGWALRQHARTDPDAVRAFLAAHGAALSGLSRREAAKHL
ncbi:MAG: DNA alkylation repair protein [Myxococcota bacterium]